MLKLVLIVSIVISVYANNKITLSKKEQTFLSNHIITCISTSTWEPFNTIQNNKLTGIAVDYWNNIEKQLRIKSKCKIVKNWSTVLYDIKHKKADLTIATTDTAKKEEYAVFSKAYVNFPIVIATKNSVGFISDISMLKNKKIAVGKNYTADHLLKKYYPSYHLIEVDNTNKALKLLCKGKVYAVVDILPVIAYKINKYGYSNIKISGKTPWNFHVKFMLRKDYATILPAINRAIDNITEEEKLYIYKKWVQIKPKTSYTLQEILIILSIFIIISFFIFFYIVHLKQEITKRKILENELEKLATIDKLTSIFNRYKMDISLEKQIEIAKRYKRPLSLIFFDIDHFKHINDTYGHKIGDIVLKQLSHMIQNSIRKSDIFGRWGGEEFLIILPETPKDEAIKIAEKLRRKIEKYKFDKIDRLTCSFGVTDFQENDTAETIMIKVDKKLYLAKETGRNRVKY